MEPEVNWNSFTYMCAQRYRMMNLNMVIFRLHLYLRKCAVARNVCICVIIRLNVQALFCQCTFGWSKFSQKCNQVRNVLWSMPMSKENCVMIVWFMMIEPSITRFSFMTCCTKTNGNTHITLLLPQPFLIEKLNHNEPIFCGII